MTHMPQSLNHDSHIMVHFMNHDYIVSLGCIPNEPKTSELCIKS